MRKALLIIDVQNDYFPNGKCPLHEPLEALCVIKKMLDCFRKQNLPVIYIQHVSMPEGAFFLPHTKGVQIHEDIEPLDTETVIIKHYPNSFYETNLYAKLKENNITDLVVCGMMTHMCIDTTVRAAKDYGYKTTLVADACATKDLKWNNNTITANHVQNVYMASLSEKFAHILMSKDMF